MGGEGNKIGVPERLLLALGELDTEDGDDMKRAGEDITRLGDAIGDGDDIVETDGDTGAGADTLGMAVGDLGADC